MRALLFVGRSLCAAAIATSLAAPAAAQSAAKNVLIISGGPEEFPGNSSFDAALRKVLFSHPTLQVAAFTEHLENEEFSEVAYTSLHDYIRAKYHGVHVDLVIANTAQALQFVLEYRNDLFPGAPVLFASAALPASPRDEHSRGFPMHSS